MKTLLVLAIALGTATAALAQTPPASTAPSAASSPHQRETTSTPAQEASPQGNPDPSNPDPGNPDPAAASTPHQKHVTEGTEKTKSQPKADAKACVAKEQSKDKALSKEDAQKSCTDQAKTKQGEQKK